MQAVAGLCLVLFVFVSTGVGVRMVLLARRTKGQPELLMGLGMTSIAGLGYPATLAAGFGGQIAAMNVPVYLIGNFLTLLGVTLIYAFTQVVFRPGVGWAKGLTALGTAFMAVSWVGSARALFAADPAATSYLVIRSWLGVAMIGYSACFLWTAIEGLVHRRMALRRLALGLADPVVANRFLLWGLFGLMASGINVTSALGNYLGLDPSRSALVLMPMGVLGGSAGVAMYLAFFPPAWYLAWLRGAARA